MLKKNFLANYIGQAWAALMGFAFIPIYIKYLGMESYALVGIFAVLQAWFGLLDLGLTSTINREMARFKGGGRTAESIRDLLRSVELVFIAIALAMSCGIVLVSTWISSFWFKPVNLEYSTVAFAISTMGFVCALRFVEGIYRSALMGLQRQVTFNVLSATMATFRGLGAVLVLAWVSSSIEAFFLWQGLISFVTLLILAIATYQILPHAQRAGRFSFNVLKDVCQFALGMMGVSLVTLGLTQIDKIILSKTLTLTEFGEYSLITTVASLVFFVIGPIVSTFAPKFCELNAKYDDIQLVNIYHLSAQIVSVIGGTASIILFIYSDTILMIWAQDTHLTNSAINLLKIMSVANLCVCLMYIPYQAQIAHGWTSLSLKTNLVAGMFIIPAMFFVVPDFGPIGAAAIYVILGLGYLSLGIHLMHRKILINEKLDWYRWDVLAPLTASAMIISLVKIIIPPQKNLVEQLLALAIASILALVASSLVSSQIRPIVLHELKKQARRATANFKKYTL